MTISVLTTVYNREARIERCVQSILSQTAGDFEYVIVDDGSTDELQRQFLIDQPDIGMLGCYVEWRREGQNATKRISFPTSHEEIVRLMPVTSALPFNSCMLRRDLFDHTGRFDETLAAGEDYALQLRALSHTRFHNLPVVLNSVQLSRDSMGVERGDTQQAVTLREGRAFLDREDKQPSVFPDPRDRSFARARLEYYNGDSGRARSLLWSLFKGSPLSLPTLRYLLPSLLPPALLARLRHAGILSAISAPLRRLGLFRRQYLP